MIVAMAMGILVVSFCVILWWYLESARENRTLKRELDRKEGTGR